MTDYLIIGQGIAGTMLSYNLVQQGAKVLVLDAGGGSGASHAAAGIINPVTGKRINLTWMTEEFLAFAPPVYRTLGDDLGINAIEACELLLFHSSEEAAALYQKRTQQFPEYIEDLVNDAAWHEYFRFSYGAGRGNHCYQVHLSTICAAWRRQLQQNHILREEVFDFSQLQTDDVGVTYKDIRASKIIFCEGAADAEHPYFRRLPFSVAKGEALIISAELPGSTIYKKELTIAPWKDGLFWAGSSYEWNDLSAVPTATYRAKATAQLKDWLQIPFEVVDHVAGIRPTTLDRTPYIGFHPTYPAVGIFNGLGSKGSLMAPYLAHNLTRHLLHGTPLLPAADISRFSRALQRG